MSSLIIAAIPAEDDYVWKISSEKVPHLTICFLGDDVSPEDISQLKMFVEHAAKTSLHRFGLSVDRRGKLGEDDADVLFFSGFGVHDISEFRSNLLKNDLIKKLYDSEDQYPQWTPHLTLGYPATPAKPDTREYPVSYVHFDKIAVWDEDYNGFEILLDSNDWESSVGVDVAMSDNPGEAFADAFLEHYGVPGMKWGRRKSNTPTDVSVTERPGARVKTSGGKNQPASEDAKRVAAAKQKAKASTTDALSTKELQELVTRMNLEQQYSRLSAKPKGKARAFINKLFTDPNQRKRTSENIAPIIAPVKSAFELGNDISRVKLDLS